jgi:hypothetical protein
MANPGTASINASPGTASLRRPGSASVARPPVNHALVRLQTYLAAETEAVRIYERLVARFPDERMEHCLQAHRQRQQALERWLHQQGGTPGSEPVEVFAACSEESLAGSMDGALTRLVECEERFAEDYRSYLHELDADSRGFIRDELLVGQRLTLHELAGRLRHSLG